jgi:hypothetical protein
VTCSYSTPDGRTDVRPQEGHPVAFFAILAAGLLLVFRRRSKLAIATAMIFGAGGLAGFAVGFVPIPFVALVVGVPLALVTTRSPSATGIAFAALAVGWLAQFFAEVPGVYAVLLVILALLPQRAEGVSQTVRSH